MNYVVVYDNTGVAEYTATGRQAACSTNTYPDILHRSLGEGAAPELPEWRGLSPHDGYKLCVIEIEMKNASSIVSPYYYPGDAYGYDGKAYPPISDGFGIDSPSWKIFADSNEGQLPKGHLAPGESEMLYYVTEVPTSTDIYGIEFPEDKGGDEVPFDLLLVEPTA